MPVLKDAMDEFAKLIVKYQLKLNRDGFFDWPNEVKSGADAIKLLFNFIKMLQSPVWYALSIKNNRERLRGLRPFVVDGAAIDCYQAILNVIDKQTVKSILADCPCVSKIISPFLPTNIEDRFDAFKKDIQAVLSAYQKACETSASVVTVMREVGMFALKRHEQAAASVLPRTETPRVPAGYVPSARL